MLLCINHNCYLYCCCVSIIIVICICPPGALISLINLFLFLFRVCHKLHSGKKSKRSHITYHPLFHEYLYFNLVTFKWASNIATKGTCIFAIGIAIFTLFIVHFFPYFLFIYLLFQALLYNTIQYNTIQYDTNLLLSIMTPNILSRIIKWITYIWFHIDWFDWFYNKERKKDNITNE